MELYVETLTGIAFELRVSPYETIIDVKAKIQKFEGIPISQQHLLWKSIELEDDYCLIDYRITNGSTLQLVLSMRCGPINTKRVPHEECSSEVSEYIDLNNKDALLKKLPLTDKPVTYLVFRDGNRLNLYRLFRDESSSNETFSKKSAHGQGLGNKHGSVPVTDSVSENEKTMKKMQALKEKLSSRINRNNITSTQHQVSHEVADNDRKSFSNELSLTKQTKFTSLPPVLRTEKDRKTNKMESRCIARENQVILQTVRGLKDIGLQESQEKNEKNRTQILRESYAKPQSISGSSHIDRAIDSKVLTANVISSKPFHYSFKSSELPNPRNSIEKFEHITRLPDVTLNNKNVAKCSICNKKLGLSNTFDCRCGRVFCSRHRYAEVHNCSFDYKSDGRKILEEKNPTVTAPKLPKI
ncbi:AN1-type zinc finger protein 4 [Trichoplax sp. H2]|nr:AN1-type zinc finger protein 4 [Trichoplax sp. H2]|eukprot:RDD47411.1 AN1-type zinc finger protein 4 [Trichoplax sp. H2]